MELPIWFVCDEALRFPANPQQCLKKEHFLVKPKKKGEITLLGYRITLSVRTNF